MSPDPAIIVYNKLLLKDKVPTSVAADRVRLESTYGKLTGYTADNTFGYTGLYGYVQKKGWANLKTIGKRLKPQTGVGAQLQLARAGRRGSVDPDLADGAVHDQEQLAVLADPRLDVREGRDADRDARHRRHEEGREPRLGEALPRLRLLEGRASSRCATPASPPSATATRRRTVARTRWRTSTRRSARRTSTSRASPRSSSTSGPRSPSAGTHLRLDRSVAAIAPDRCIPRPRRPFVAGGGVASCRLGARRRPDRRAVPPDAVRVVPRPAAVRGGRRLHHLAVPPAVPRRRVLARRGRTRSSTRA